MNTQLIYKVTSDSMNNGLPDAIVEGRMVIAERIDRELWAKEFESNPARKYVIVHPEAVVIAWVTILSEADQLINCHVLNPDYADYKMSLPSITDILRITHFETAGRTFTRAY